MTQKKRNGRPKVKRSVIEDQKLSNLSLGRTTSNFSTSYRPGIGTNNRQSSSLELDYDNMELNQHLIDLWTVLRNIAKTVFITTAIILIIPGYSHGTLLINPYKPFILQLLNVIINYSLNALSTGGDVQVFVGSPLAPITFYLNLGAFVAILISLPLTIKELMAFVKPGLTEKEWEILLKLSKVASALFLLGAFVSYFVIMPLTLKILAISGGIVGDGNLLQMYSLDAVLNLLLWGTLGGGLLYASPVILLALIDLNTISPDQIAGRKREINFAVFVIAAFVTPDPTIVSMLILSLPMVIIIEFIIAMGYKIELEKLTG